MHTRLVAYLNGQRQVYKPPCQPLDDRILGTVAQVPSVEVKHVDVVDPVEIWPTGQLVPDEIVDGACNDPGIRKCFLPKHAEDVHQHCV